DLQAGLLRVEPVEFPGELDEGVVAARDHVGNDGAHRLFDVGCAVALGGEKRLEPGSEIGGAGIETDRHRLLMPGLEPGIHGKILSMSKRWIAGSSPGNDDTRMNLWVLSQPCAGVASSGCAGQVSVVQMGPRSASSHSRHSTSRRSAPPPEKSS